MPISVYHDPSPAHSAVLNALLLRVSTTNKNADGEPFGGQLTNKDLVDFYGDTTTDRDIGWVLADLETRWHSFCPKKKMGYARSADGWFIFRRDAMFTLEAAEKKKKAA